MPSGGKRAGAGRKAGSRTAETLSKAESREILRAIVMRHMEDMVDAQVKHAKGIKFLVKRAKAGGKFEKVSADELDAALEGQAEDRVVLEVWDKDPSVQAFTDLMNRALDKPAEQEQAMKVTGNLTIKWQGN